MVSTLDLHVAVSTQRLYLVTMDTEKNDALKRFSSIFINLKFVALVNYYNIMFIFVYLFLTQPDDCTQS